MLPKCAKCGGHSYRLQEVEPMGAAFKQVFVQCTSCAAPVGVTNYFDTGTLLKKQEKQIVALGARLSQIEGALQQIAYAVDQLARRR